jgi:hypothetical protein
LGQTRESLAHLSIHLAKRKISSFLPEISSQCENTYLQCENYLLSNQSAPQLYLLLQVSDVLSFPKNLWSDTPFLPTSFFLHLVFLDFDYTIPDHFYLLTWILLVRGGTPKMKQKITFIRGAQTFEERAGRAFDHAMRKLNTNIQQVIRLSDGDEKKTIVPSLPDPMPVPSASVSVTVPTPTVTPQVKRRIPKKKPTMAQSSFLTSSTNIHEEKQIRYLGSGSSSNRRPTKVQVLPEDPFLKWFPDLPTVPDGKDASRPGCLETLSPFLSEDEDPEIDRDDIQLLKLYCLPWILPIVKIVRTLKIKT